MTRVKLYYEGWLALPAALRDALGLHTDSMLEAELIEGTIVLRPAASTRSLPAAEPETAAFEFPAAAAPALPVPAKRKPGRPRKAAAGEPAPELMLGLPGGPVPARRKPGRPRKVLPAQQLEPEPQPALASLTGVGLHSELRRKLTPPATTQDRRAAQDEDHAWAMPASEREPEERRPFRQVEVRKLAPRSRAGGRRRVEALAAE